MVTRKQPPKKMCGWWNPHRAVGCDGTRAYVDEWSGRIVHQMIHGHRPVDPDGPRERPPWPQDTR